MGAQTGCSMETAVTVRAMIATARTVQRILITQIREHLTLEQQQRMTKS